MSYKTDKIVIVCANKLLQLRPTLCDPVDCSLLGSSIHGILQARILEWVAMPSSKGSSWPSGWTYFSYVSCIGYIHSTSKIKSVT